MKFRLRYLGATFTLNAPEITSSTKVDDLIIFSQSALLTNGVSFTGDIFELSLNGIDPLNDDTTLAENGIVSGDLLKVVTGESDNNQRNPTSSSHQNHGGQQQMSSIVASTERNFFIPTELATVIQTGFVQSHKADFLCCALHYCATSVGFAMEETLFTPTTWRSGALYVLCYKHQHLEGKELKLYCSVLGNKFAINGTISSEGNPDYHRNMSLTVGRYVSHTDKDDLTNAFIDFDELSKAIKDDVLLPLLSDASDAPLFGILTLPDEVLLKIAVFLDYRSLALLASVTTRLHALLIDPCLWRRLYVIHFGSRFNNSMDQNWLGLFRDEMVNRKRGVASGLPHPPPYILDDPTFVPRPSIPPMDPFQDPFSNLFVGGPHDINPLGGPSRNPFGIPRPRFGRGGHPHHPFGFM